MSSDQHNTNTRLLIWFTRYLAFISSFSSVCVCSECVGVRVCVCVCVPTAPCWLAAGEAHLEGDSRCFLVWHALLLTTPEKKKSWKSPWTSSCSVPQVPGRCEEREDSDTDPPHAPCSDKARPLTLSEPAEENKRLHGNGARYAAAFRRCCWARKCEYYSLNYRCSEESMEALSSHVTTYLIRLPHDNQFNYICFYLDHQLFMWRAPKD